MTQTKNRPISAPNTPKVQQGEREPQTAGEISAEIDRLEALGVAPNGAWINVSVVGGKKFKQARWKSREPCFSSRSGSNPEAKCRSQYIEVENGAEHQAAIALVKRRNEVRALHKKLGERHVQQ